MVRVTPRLGVQHAVAVTAVAIAAGAPTGCASLDNFFFSPVKENISVELLAAAGNIPASRIAERIFTTSDGVTLQGFYAVPETYAANAPAILYCHGNSTNITRYWERVEIFTEQLGWPVFIFDYRGYGESEGEPSEDGIVRDARAALDVLAAEPGIDPDRIVYYGWSLGGYAALHLAIVRPPAAVVTEAAFANAESIIGDSSGLSLPQSWLVEGSFDNVQAIARIEAPKLIIHGDADDFVSAVNGQRLFMAAAEPKEYYSVSGADHGDIPNKGGAGYLQNLRNFVAQNVP